MKKIPGEKDPRHNLSQRRAIKKIQELAKSARVCFFGTHAGRTLAVRPMAIQDVDNHGNVWFLSGRSSAHNRQIARNPRVQLLFSNVRDSQYLNLHGTATISDDPKLIDEHWTPIAKTWFHEGKSDPETTVIKVRVDTGYYWDTEYGKTVALLSIALGTLTGKTLDNSVEGVVRPQKTSKSRHSSRRRKR